MKHVSKIGVMTIALAFTATAFVAGCAKNVPLRTESTTSGIRAAEEAGAAAVPQASLHLQLAKDQLEMARELAAKGKQEKAESMLLRAEADAELALLLAREDAQKAEAKAALERVRKLQNDNQLQRSR